MKERLERVRELATPEAGDAFLVSAPPAVTWLTGFTGSFGQVLLTADGGEFLTDSRYTIQAAEEVEGLEVATFAAPTKYSEHLAARVQALGIRRVLFQPEALTYKAVEEYRAALGQVELIPGSADLAPLRMIKTPDEVEKIRRACALADAAFAHIRNHFRVGATEREVELELDFYIRRHGAELAFPSIVVSGENSARPHGKATQKALTRGDFLTLDFGARLAGYNSDLTRTVVIGEPTPRHREVYETVLRAQLAALEMMRPGVAARDVDALARKVLDERDLARYFGHSLGHGLGREVHDAGSLGGTSKDVLAEGQVWTVEPGAYIPGFGGVRIEDDVVVTRDGIEILTHAPKELLHFG